MTSLATILNSIQLLAFDSSPLIYFVEDHPKYGALMAGVFQYVENKQIAGISSTLTLTEVLTVPIRKGDLAVQQAYQEILTNHPYFTLIPLSTAVCERAAHLRATYNLRTPDALQIAVAIEANCDAFLTNDVQLTRVTEIKVLVLNEFIEDADNR